jgi:pyridoxamine 5'-phosphate oxidase
MDPVERIQSDRAQARSLDDPNADLCFLALADSSGHASVRTLVLRDITELCITLFINRTSPKWHIIDRGGDAELLIWYPSVQRQYRIRGTLTEIDAKTIVTNWQRRPVGSKYLDHVYEEMGAQSSFIDSRESLTSKLGDLKSSTSSDDLSVPPSATGVSLNYSSIDMLDLNKEDRIHDRQLFTLTGNSWISKVMIP